MSGRVIIVGGGVAGLCCAYYLRREGHEVTVVESNRVGSGASFANGGWLCPAQAGPLPEPGLTLYGMRALFDRDSALYFKPGDLHRLAPWLLRFRTYCNEEDHAHGTAAIARLGHDVSTWSRRCGPTASSSSSTSRAWCSPPRARRRPLGAPQARPDARARVRLPDDIVVDDELHELEPALARSSAPAS